MGGITMKKALITGINGQDGSYLAELLLEKGYEVHGVIRQSSIENQQKISFLKNNFDQLKLHVCSLNNHLSIYKLLDAIRPDECYHLAAASFVSYSFEDEASILATNLNPTHFFLSSIKELVPKCKFYFAGSSEMFGNIDVVPQQETTRFNPRSIYGISKLASHYVVKNYREHHGLYACTGFCYNHESPRRNHAFVTRKITSGTAKIYLKQEEKIQLGNIDAIRDWGYAPEYVEAMWMMLNNPSGPKDYIIATGIPHTVRDLLDIAFSLVDLDYTKYIEINNNFFRPGEQIPLLGDASNIHKDLGWEPKTRFDTIIEEMLLNDINLLK
jgi:GDPmannose 4,6-dehydratase